MDKEENPLTKINHWLYEITIELQELRWIRVTLEKLLDYLKQLTEQNQKTKTPLDTLKELNKKR